MDDQAPAAAYQSELDLLEERLGYRFLDRTLLVQATTHCSFANEQISSTTTDNERLEFLGDAVLSLAITSRLLALRPAASEGVLTQQRAELVNASTLAALARTLRLGECLRLGRGEMRSGGQTKDNLLADAMEAVLGAIFLDGGYRAAAAAVERLFTPDGVPPIGVGEGDAKTRLQELLQARRQPLPVYHLVMTSGPDHQRQYEVDVSVDGQVCGRGAGGSKKRAEQAAALAALDLLRQDADA